VYIRLKDLSIPATQSKDYSMLLLRRKLLLQYKLRQSVREGKF
jgi:hypothetical protein